MCAQTYDTANYQVAAWGTITAIEDTELPEQIFCFKGATAHLTDTDAPQTTSGLRQVIMSTEKLYHTYRKGA